MYLHTDVSTRGCMLLEEGHPETPPEPKTEEEWEPSPSVSDDCIMLAYEINLGCTIHP